MEGKKEGERIWYTWGGVARRFGCRLWQVRRLYERGLLEPAQRAGHLRVVSEADLPVIEAALRRAGYLPSKEGHHGNRFEGSKSVATADLLLSD